MEQTLKTGAIYSGPAWRLWMILNHPALRLAESLLRQQKELLRIWTPEEISDREDPSHDDQ